MRKLHDYLKIADAARFIGVSQNTLRKWADEDRIGVRLNPANGYRLFQRDDLEAFLRKTARPTRRKPR